MTAPQLETKDLRRVVIAAAVGNIGSYGVNAARIQ